MVTSVFSLQQPVGAAEVRLEHSPDMCKLSWQGNWVVALALFLFTSKKGLHAASITLVTPDIVRSDRP
ncbi:hypothetical protein [Bosea sp. FBZP-16]|uniref:hypothetical protein n=1 Tax=Bosea sp. FBZP-16 TaxID=2065382 RepID=UPI0018F89879|nr:hypothetical protein [Bosea sp. FBZP-16]